MNKICCPNCGSVAVVPVEDKSKWEKNVGYKSEWKKNNSAKVQYACKELDCLTVFEAPILNKKEKQRLTVEIDFAEWKFEVIKSFNTKKGKGCFLKIFHETGTTYLGVAFGEIAEDFLEWNIRGVKIAELNYDKKMELKLFFND